MNMGKVDLNLNAEKSIANISVHKFYSLHTYRQISNIIPTWVDNKIVDHSDIVRASPVGAAPTKSSF